MDSGYGRLLAAPRGSFFLSGPRGTGKSTWLRRTFPQAHVLPVAAFLAELEGSTLALGSELARPRPKKRG
jgi:hypothetical protein